MKIHDYSYLLKAIDEVNEKEIVVKKEIEANKEKEMYTLINKLNNSGMLDDWCGLIKAMKKLKIRGCPYPYGDKIPGVAEFRDGYVFSKCMSSGSHWSDYFGIKPDFIGGFTFVITHTTSSHLWEDWNSFKGNPAYDEVSNKIKIIEDFMEAYPIYKEYKLKEIYETMGEKVENIERLKENI